MDGTISKVLQMGSGGYKLSTSARSAVTVGSVKVARHTIPCSWIGRLHFLLTPLPASTTRLPKLWSCFQISALSTGKWQSWLLHDDRVRVKLVTEYNFFANKTWFCIKSLLQAHITEIQIYYVMDNNSISQQTMNTDTVECFFGDAQQMVCGSTNKLTAAWFERADKKASTFMPPNSLKLATILQVPTCLVKKKCLLLIIIYIISTRHIKSE